jgi:LPXTG-site transpeptidase (sortase) family protein
MTVNVNDDVGNEQIISVKVLSSSEVNQSQPISSTDPGTLLFRENSAQVQLPVQLTARQQPSKVLKRQLVRSPRKKRISRLTTSYYSAQSDVLIGVACVVFVVGVFMSLLTLQTNHNAAAKVAALSKQVDKQASSGSQDNSFPSTTKPTSQEVNQYYVAPDLPRYLIIPKLNVKARVLQTGIIPSGAVGTANDIFDTAWYTGSAKPGGLGATVIDGHVSGWTTHGVFYSLDKLTAGDTVQIMRGDGVILNYQVMKTQTYSAQNVDMKAAMTPITNGKSGLNLITCTGQVQKSNNQYSERFIVFAQQT